MQEYTLPAIHEIMGVIGTTLVYQVHFGGFGFIHLN